MRYLVWGLVIVYLTMAVIVLHLLGSRRAVTRSGVVLVAMFSAMTVIAYVETVARLLRDLGLVR